MPVYEFVCHDCGWRFSELCRLSWEGSVKCPACGGAKLSKLLSRFGVPGGRSGCASCTGKNCAGCQ